MPSPNVSHDNHIVPQWYLRSWSDRNGLVWCYPLLVSHENVPIWGQHPLKGIAYRRDLYTLTSEGQDVDDHERWLKEKFEDPASTVVKKAVQGKNLTPAEWRTLVLFAVCQDLRTPQSFSESMEYAREHFPNTIQKSLEQAVEQLKRRAASDEPARPVVPDPGTKWLSEAFKFSIRHDTPQQGLAEIGTHLLLGRDFWLRTQRHILGGIAESLVDHSWCIATAAKHIEWFTSDHPVAKLMPQPDGEFSLGSGWAVPGEIICMPLSRRHLLVTEVGVELPQGLRLSKAMTMFIRRAIAARAWRTIFALQEVPDVPTMRPRRVDREAYEREREGWEDWHSRQTAAEQNHFDDR